MYRMPSSQPLAGEGEGEGELAQGLVGSGITEKAGLPPRIEKRFPRLRYRPSHRCLGIHCLHRSYAPLAASDAPVQPVPPPAQISEAPRSEGQTASVSSDRLELTAMVAPKAPRSTVPLDLELAQLALRMGATLTDAQTYRLRERVRTGYYDYPATIDRIGEAVARDLAARPGKRR